MNECCLYLAADLRTGGTKFGISYAPSARLSQLRCREGYPGLVLFHYVVVDSRLVARRMETWLRMLVSDPPETGPMCGKWDWTPDSPREVMRVFNLVYHLTLGLFK